MRCKKDDGLGFDCDVCNRHIGSWDTIHIKAQVLYDSKGGHRTVGRLDICKRCYGKILQPYIRAPRTRCKAI